ncbi:MAG: ArsR family transcriptional regulator [Nanoarchaeota archaeon]|nr:ArsR family transcriptional regulator [Nanoarchaeota archaeon]MBU1029851.1 ArsR family transcriptional regulator [Nanoarchaeota archaeon]MBU1849423.1 ArsR family transcriptional regulator [Nanoarchaeota archaeon]
MDQETLFTGSKWDILQLLEENELSPIELADKSGTSMANISQQLRFLEMAGLVTSKRISNRDKGQPRILYSLSGDHSFLIAVSKGFVEKKLFELTEYQKMTLKIWFYEKSETHIFIEQAITKILPYLEKIDLIAIDRNSSDLSLILVGYSHKVSQEQIKDLQGTSKTVKFVTKTEESAKKMDLYTVYNPKKIILGKRG